MLHKYIECQCGIIEHMLRFSYDWHPDPRYAEIYIDVHLNQYYGFFRRFWYGLKYILGFKSKWGHFDETVIDRKKTIELRDFLNEWIEKHLEAK